MEEDGERWRRMESEKLLKTIKKCQVWKGVGWCRKDVVVCGREFGGMRGN